MPAADVPAADAPAADAPAADAPAGDLPAGASPSAILRAPAPGWPHAASPFHPGEVAAQARAGVRERAERSGRRGIRAAMPDQHRDFFALLPFLLVGSVDAAGRPWASVLTGAPGFARSPDPQTLAVAARPDPADPLAAALAPGAPLGLLGIQLETRRRNRMNGRVAAVDARGFAVTVDQSFGNCAQYIQARVPHRAAADPAPGARPAEGARLSPAAVALVGRADTLFLATAAPGAGVDLSHRGGRPGFVRVETVAGRTVLTLPDFAGNAFLNTVGNILADPRAGLAVIDFDAGALLQLTGGAAVLWDGPEVAAFAGAQRLLRLTPEAGRWSALPLRWSVPDFAPQLAGTGAWPPPA